MKLYLTHFMLIIIETSCLLKVDFIRNNATSQSHTHMNAYSSLAVDDNLETCSISFKGMDDEDEIWWMGKLDGIFKVTKVAIAFSSNETLARFSMEQLHVYISRYNPMRNELCNYIEDYRFKNPGPYLYVVCSKILPGKYVIIRNMSKYGFKMLVLCEVYVYADVDTVSLAYGRPTFQSGWIYHYMSKLLVDGYKDTCGKVKADGNDFGWWRVSLDKPFHISGINVIFKPNSTEAMTFNHCDVYISNDDRNFEEQLCASFILPTQEENENGSVQLNCKENPSNPESKDKAMKGKFVTIKRTGGKRPQWLMLCEVQVYAADLDCQPDEIKCEITSTCLPLSTKCDKINQCPDGSDESNCSCPLSQYRCEEGKCIPTDWLCDGTKDCPLGEDEVTGCDCKEKYFKCTRNKKCIDYDGRCDGVVDCPDYSDENGCYVLLDDFLMLKYRSEMLFHVCARNWLTEFSALICENYFRSSLKESYSGEIASKPIQIMFLPLEQSNRNAIPELSSFELGSRMDCFANKFVKIKCLSNNLTGNEGFCGTRVQSHSQLRPYIINGELAEVGAWPWHAQIIVNQFYKCGGSVLGREWILTSASCLDGISTDSEILVKVGTNIKNDPGVDSLQVSQIVAHPNYNASSSAKNMALIKVESPMKLSNLVKPICLPNGKLDERDLQSFRLCIVSGYGSTDRDRTESMFLLQGRLGIITSQHCNDLINILDLPPTIQEFINKEMFCAGQESDLYGIKTCAGDEGSPLVCLGSDGLWTQIGIVSGFEPGGHEKCLTNLITRIDNDAELYASALNLGMSSDPPSDNVSKGQTEEDWGSPMRIAVGKFRVGLSRLLADESML